jgi:sec-independent protein translocase protein TatA
MDLFAPSHLLILLVIILVIFGPSKLGDLGGVLGKTIRDFKHAMNEPEPAAQDKTTTPTPNTTPAESKADKPA